ncbi:hypothetical protein K1T71_008206 [Dendrolimus kikuchii]|uniref:Uncharacterized protein n=1 Tax=Dendrolimus kikuchii TaxID=765133 RepID=A0ACC1CY32_9NEOP|nr:hypothetical protein K1T71_008206 [Dendrolimus kikuchii]
MFITTFLLCFVLKVVQCQLNGEFWWLNEKVAKYNHALITPPIIEHISELDTDENANIVFRDDNDLMYSDKDKSTNQVITTTESVRLTSANSDIDIDLIWPIQNKDNNENKNLLTHYLPTPLTTFGNDQILDSENKEPESQNICNYMEKDKCQLRKGFVYTLELQIMLAKKAHDPDLICCILPSTDHIANEDYSKVTFVNNPKTLRLQKRSTSGDETINQKQRKVLLERLLSQTRNIRLSATQSKVVTPDDDYPDPYWNIKNTKFQDKQAQNTRTRYGDSSKDYIEDYVDELPKPGLIGIYSDTVLKKRNPSWQFINRKPATTYGVDVVYDSVESDETFGYSTVDPRKVVSSKPKSGTPAKLSTVSDEKQSFHPESEIISFQSNPDFKVFQGFKLINNAKKKNKQTKTALTDVEDETESKESEEKIIHNVPESDDYDSKEETQIFENCGRAVEWTKTSQKDKQTGETDSGSHPWLGLVVETKRRFNILCYTTIIHPRIAITAAQCVFGTTLGEITVIAGLWNLNERTRSRSRVVSIHVHPEYVPGDLVNDLAILYWQHPLRLGVNVQPACLASHDINEGCMFFGWGEFEAIRPRSRWQKATIRECKKGRLAYKENESEDLFCASLPQSRTSVIGKGSPLICNIEGRHSMHFEAK